MLQSGIIFDAILIKKPLNTMKKLFALLLICGFVFTLAACDSTPKSESTVEEAVEAVEDAVEEAEEAVEEVIEEVEETIEEETEEGAE
jgi:cell shape-determining protein MreC